ncbi:MAG: elongation factor Ts [Gammaproteobacteria bacterium]|nr:elongation factor Ts [Gammaproteobacteria bacterium]
MAITAALVKELRERSGAGMMECKKALVETDGDIDAAIEHMRKTGLAKADKKASRTAAEGKLVIQFSDDGKKAVMLEVNCETDFVAIGDDFGNFADNVASQILNGDYADVDAVLASNYGDTSTSVDDTLKGLVAKIGEKMTVRRFKVITTDGLLGQYIHGKKIGVVVELDGGTEELAKDVAMHVAATNPSALNEEALSPELVAKEREIAMAEAANSGKPENIIEKIVDGKIKKFMKENTLLGQSFVKDPDVTIEKLVKDAGATILSYERIEVGAGIEKKVENFAEEVMAQVNS